MNPIIADLQIFKDLLKLVRRIYQHESCPGILKSYIRFEMGRFFAKDIDIKSFLEEEYERQNNSDYRGDGFSG